MTRCKYATENIPRCIKPQTKMSNMQVCYLLTKNPFGHDVTSYRLPSRVTTVTYRKSPCSFLWPGGGFQQLRDKSLR